MIIRMLNHKDKFVNEGTITLNDDNTVTLKIPDPAVKESFSKIVLWIGPDAPKTYTPKDGENYMIAVYYKFRQASLISLVEEPNDIWYRELRYREQNGFPAFHT